MESLSVGTYHATPWRKLIVKILMVAICGFTAGFDCTLGYLFVYSSQGNNKEAISIKGSEIFLIDRDFEAHIDSGRYDLDTFSTGIDTILGDEKQHYSIYIKSLSNNFVYALHENELFFPGSILKVPTAILTLQDVESGKYTLQTKLELKDENKSYVVDPLYHYPEGTFFTIESLLYYMIHFSDNTAWDILQDNLGSTAFIDLRIHTELLLPRTNRVPFETTASELGLMFERLYNHEYLSQEHTEYLLELLSGVSSNQNDRIVAGLPAGTKVAHKIGNWAGTWEDAGIVYSAFGDYIIVVLNKETTTAKARKKIPEISAEAWKLFELISI